MFDLIQLFQELHKAGLLTIAFTIGAIAIFIAIVGKIEHFVDPSPQAVRRLWIFGGILLFLSLLGFWLGAQPTQTTAVMPTPIVTITATTTTTATSIAVTSIFTDTSILSDTVRGGVPMTAAEDEEQFSSNIGDMPAGQTAAEDEQQEPTNVDGFGLWQQRLPITAVVITIAVIIVGVIVRKRR